MRGIQGPRQQREQRQRLKGTAILQPELPSTSHMRCTPELAAAATSSGALYTASAVSCTSTSLFRIALKVSRTKRSDGRSLSGHISPGLGGWNDVGEGEGEANEVIDE